MTQDSFLARMYRPTDPSTSRAAAMKVNKGLSVLQSAVLHLFHQYKDLTDSEIEHYFSNGTVVVHIAPTTARRRRTDLLQMGLVQPTGQKRNNQYGNAEQVFELNPILRK